MNAKLMALAEIPYETTVKKAFGLSFKYLDESDREGAIGIAIIKSILNGVRIDFNDISKHLDLDYEVVSKSYRNLSMNGLFLRNKIFKDRMALDKDDKTAWCYYAGYASGKTGNYIPNN